MWVQINVHRMESLKAELEAAKKEANEMKEKLKQAVKKGKGLEKEKGKLEASLEAAQKEAKAAEPIQAMLKSAQGRAAALEDDLVAVERELADTKAALEADIQHRLSVEGLISELQVQLREAVMQKEALIKAHGDKEAGEAAKVEEV